MPKWAVWMMVGLGVTGVAVAGYFIWKKTRTAAPAASAGAGALPGAGLLSSIIGAVSQYGTASPGGDRERQ